MTVCIAGKDARVTVLARRGGQDIAQTAAFSVETLTAFIGDPWLIVREGLREFATANAGAVPRRGSDVGTSPLLGTSGVE